MAQASVQARVPPAAHVLANDAAAIEAVVWTYLDGLYEGDTDKLAAAFHPCSHLYGEDNGGVLDWPREHWLDVVRKRPSAKSQGHPRHDRIVSIDQSDRALLSSRSNARFRRAFCRLSEHDQNQRRLARRRQGVQGRDALSAGSQAALSSGAAAWMASACTPPASSAASVALTRR